MKKTIKRMLTLLCALTLLLTLGGCGQKAEEGNSLISTGGRDIEKGYAADHVFSLNSNSNFSLNPSVATNHSNQLICSLVYENLVEIDNNFEVIEGAGLIKEWSCSDDGKTWTLTDDTTHVFHDGSPVTGNDMRMSIEYCINSDRYTGRFASVQGVSYTDSQLIIALGIPNKQFIKLLNVPVVKVGTNGDKHPMGSGPYMYNEEGTQLLAFNGHNGYSNLPVDVIYLKEYSTAEDIIAAFEGSAPLPRPICITSPLTSRATAAATTTCARRCSTPSTANISQTRCCTATAWRPACRCIPPARSTPPPWPIR